VFKGHLWKNNDMAINNWELKTERNQEMIIKYASESGRGSSGMNEPAA
jgi:hypothetical protein